MSDVPAEWAALIEAAGNLGFELGKAEGRKEAAEQIAREISMYNQEWSANTWRSIAAGIAREVASEPSGAASTPRTHPDGHSDLPEGGEAAEAPLAAWEVELLGEASKCSPFCKQVQTGPTTWECTCPTPGGSS